MALLVDPASFISTRSLTRRLTAMGSTMQIALIISTRSLTRRLTSAYKNKVFGSGISTRSLTRRLTDGDIFRSPKDLFQLAASRGG